MFSQGPQIGCGVPVLRTNNCTRCVCQARRATRRKANPPFQNNKVHCVLSGRQDWFRVTRLCVLESRIADSRVVLGWDCLGGFFLEGRDFKKLTALEFTWSRVDFFARGWQDFFMIGKVIEMKGMLLPTMYYGYRPRRWRRRYRDSCWSSFMTSAMYS